MSLTTKEILNIAKEIYTKQYSAAYLNDINSEIFPQLISKILKVFETRIVNYEKLIKKSEREWGYRRIQLDAAVVISLLKYFFYNDKSGLYKGIISNDEKETFKQKIFKNFDQDDVNNLFINMSADLIIVSQILEKLGDKFVEDRRFWLLVKFDKFAVQVIKNVYDDTFNSFVLSTFDSDNFHKRLFDLIMFESQKNLTFTQTIDEILKGADMPYKKEIEDNGIDSLQRLRKFFAQFI